MELVASIKEKRRLKEDLINLEPILASISDAVIITSTDGTVIMANPASELITMYAPHELIGRNIKEILNLSCDETDAQQFLKEALEGWRAVELPHNCVLKRPRGNPLPIAGTAAPLYMGGGAYAGVVLTIRDRSDEVKAREHQEEIARLKDEFVALASHQLRTPPSIINWYSEMLLSGEVGELNGKQKEYVDEIYRATKRMVDLINDFLNISRVESGALAITPEPTNLSETADTVIKELAAVIHQKGSQVEKHYDKDVPIINADRICIKVIFQNLISNAIKYTPPGGKVSITIKKEEPNVLIEIADNGYGIPLNQQSKIFTKLFRAENIRKKEAEGTGLGLYLVKSVVERAGGTIRFESKENQGTTFYVTIPLSGMKEKEGNVNLV